MMKEPIKNPDPNCYRLSRVNYLYTENADMSVVIHFRVKSSTIDVEVVKQQYSH